MKLNPTKRSALADISAVTLSFLCLFHCLLLPFVTSLLPVLGVVSENELIHKILVLIAIPISISIFLPSMRSNPVNKFVAVLLLIGCGLLFSAAFIEMFEAHETNLTVLGAVLISSAHIMRMMRRHKA